MDSYSTYTGHKNHAHLFWLYGYYIWEHMHCAEFTHSMSFAPKKAQGRQRQ